MKANEVNEELIGKRCKCIFTGLMVTGTIEDIQITQYTAEVKVRYDNPHRWGDDWYEEGWASARLSDDFGSLHHLGVIDAAYQTVRVRFEQPIVEIDRLFVQDYSTWGVVNLKEMVDGFESSRMTQINHNTAIMTSEYNMDNLEQWLAKHTAIISIEHLN